MVVSVSLYPWQVVDGSSCLEMHHDSPSHKDGSGLLYQSRTRWQDHNHQVCTWHCMPYHPLLSHSHTHTVCSFALSSRPRSAYSYQPLCSSSTCLMVERNMTNSFKQLSWIHSVLTDLFMGHWEIFKLEDRIWVLVIFAESSSFVLVDW